MSVCFNPVVFASVTKNYRKKIILLEPNDGKTYFSGMSKLIVVIHRSSNNSLEFRCS